MPDASVTVRPTYSKGLRLMKVTEEVEEFRLECDLE